MTLHRPFKSVLIANRGEIARRIANEAWKAQIKSYLAYTDVEWADETFMDAVDKAVHIGEAGATSPFLDIGTLIHAAKDNEVEAIHPGYGFLSENAEFAQAVVDAGLVWIGPLPKAIRAMGDKGEAKRLAHSAGIPVIAGYNGEDQTDNHLLTEAKRIGWPVLIKAANGGGGRGQRRVDSEADFAEALASARREALSAFASDRMILERALDGVRHIEIQIVADAHGSVVHLGERDCSIQRRNQKIIEEAPALGISDHLRNQMGDAAVRLAKSVGYVNAGTVEFLLDQGGNFYFLEMNTRIQVEHPVTEEITGRNLIQLQFDIASGKPLPFAQQDVAFEGFAIEVRLCAEDASNGFAPQTGTFRYPNPFGTASTILRVDRGFARVTTHYDSMVAKLIAHGRSREAAIQKLMKGLRASKLIGLKTNRDYLLSILESSSFRTGGVPTSFLSQFEFTAPKPLEGTLGNSAAIFAADHHGSGWSSTGSRRSLVTLRHGDERKNFIVDDGAVNSIKRFQGLWPRTIRTGDDVCGLPLIIDGKKTWVQCLQRKRRIYIEHEGEDAIFEDITYAPAEPKGSGGANVIRAPMAGRIIKVAAEPGQAVAKNQVLVILEAMKMEHELKAATDGVVETVTAKPGDQVAIRQTLVTLNPSKS